MKKFILLSTLGCSAFVAAANGQAVTGNWSQTWADEFNSSTDLNGWTYQTGGGGWGNGEAETYTNSSANSFVSTDNTTGIGALTIRAIASGSGGNKTYTSARITSQNLFSQANGLFEFRAKLPAGTGLWPALWMMPKNSVYGGWPTSGEIDVMESKGEQTSVVQGSLHSGTSSSTEDNQTGYYQPAGFDTTQWHTYDLEWDAGTSTNAATIKFFVDGHLYETQHGGWVVPSGASPSAPFDQPFYLIMNLAVGGNYVSTPNLANGNYDMQVDYVRAYSVANPEPASLGLLGLAGLMLRRHRKA